MVAIAEHYHDQMKVILDGEVIGYVSRTKGSGVAIVREIETIPPASIGEVCRALDERDGGPYPDRILCVLGMDKKASDYTTYA